MKNTDTEGFYLLGDNAMYSVESQPALRRKMSPPSSELKSKPNKKQHETGSNQKFKNVGLLFFITNAVGSSNPKY
jgi:hypothetical protein